jgi:zinc transport system substrate-binding protein
MVRRMKLLVVATICLVLAARPSNGAERQLKVLTSFAPLYSLAANVVGPDADLENLLPAGTDPHEFQLSPRDAKKVSDSNLILLNGLGMESWLDRMLKGLGGDSKRVLLLSRGLEKEWIPGALESVHEADHGIYEGRSDFNFNPHLWLDPILASAMVTNIVAALASADPVHAADYQRRGADYIVRLKKLDAEYRSALEPLREKPFLTFHDAFAYLARRYGLRKVGVVQEIGGIDPSPKSMDNLYKTARRTGALVLFCDPPPSPNAPLPKKARQIASDLRVKLATLDSLESGPLSPEFYESGMRANLEALRKGLQ